MSREKLIPIVSLSSEKFSSSAQFDTDSFQSGTHTRINLRFEGPEECYGIRIQDDSLAPVLKPGKIAVFTWRDRSALQQIFCLGRKGCRALLCRFVKHENPAAKAAAPAPEGDPLQRPGRTKSFMTPTPLHIPGSRVSPIADSIHQRMYFLALDDPRKLILVHPDEVLWMHPLIYIAQEKEF